MLIKYRHCILVKYVKNDIHVFNNYSVELQDYKNEI